MAQLTPEQFEAMLAGGVSDAQTRTSSVNTVQQVTAPFAPQTFEQKYQRPGVPLDTQTGAPWGARVKLSFAPDEESAQQIARNAFRGSTVEPTEDGNLIVRGVLDPETQSVKDLVIDERRMSAKDFLDLANVVPEMVAAGLAIRGGQGVLNRIPQGIRRITADAVVGAGAAQTMGALNDSAVRLGLGRDLDMAETIMRRGKAAAGEALLGGALGAAVNTVARGVTRASRPRTQNAASGLEARDRLAEETGITIPMSWGEETGSSIALRTEAIASKTPTGGGFFKAQSEAGVEGMRSMQRYLIGDGPIPPNAELGMQAIDTLRQYTQAAEQGVNFQVARIANKAAEQVSDAIETSTGIAKTVQKPVAGSAVRAGVDAHHKAFRQKAEELYSAIGVDPALPTTSLKAQLQKVKDEMVKAKNIVTEESMLRDQHGRPITSTIEGKEVVQELVPEGLQKFLRGIEKLDEEMPLSELRALRTRVNDAISQSEILAGTPSRILKSFSASISEAIETGAKSLPDPTVAQKLSQANQFYRENLPRFQTKGVLELLADPQQLKLDDWQVVNEAARSPGQYFRLKEILTTPIKAPDGSLASPANMNGWNLLKRSLLTEIEDRARLAGTGRLISGKKFIDEINKLEPEVARDLLGPDAHRAIAGARTLGVLEGKVDAEEFIAALQKGDMTGNDIRKLMAQQKDLDRLYQDKVIKKFVKGEIGDEAINPGEFVERFLVEASDEQEVSRIMAMLNDNPKVADSIRAKVVQNLFQDSAAEGQSISRLRQGDATVDLNAAKLEKNILKNREKLRAVLGDNTVRQLEDFALVTKSKGGAEVESATKAVGGLVGGSLLSSLMRLEIAKVPDHIKFWFVGRALTSSTFRNAFRPGANVDPTTFTRALIVSAPMIEAATEDFGVGAGTLMLDMLANGVNMARERENPAPQQQSEDSLNMRRGATLSPEEFEAQLSQ